MEREKRIAESQIVLIPTANMVGMCVMNRSTKNEQTREKKCKKAFCGNSSLIPPESIYHVIYYRVTYLDKTSSGINKIKS